MTGVKSFSVTEFEQEIKSARDIDLKMTALLCLQELLRREIK